MPIRKDFAAGEFCWIDLTAHDMKAAIAWYAGVFGWTHMTMDTPEGGSPYAFLTAGENAVGGIGEASPEMKAQGVPATWNSYINSEDCEATEAKVRELGGMVTVPTMTIPGHGKLAYFLDPEGACFAAWQTLNPDGPGLLVGEPGGLCWNELMTRDTGKATAFYGALAGWDFTEMPMGEISYTMAKAGETDAAGMLTMTGEQYEGVPPHWLVYFSVGDCDEIAEKAAATGGTVMVPPMDIPVGRMSIIADPQGAAFGIIKLADVNC